MHAAEAFTRERAEQKLARFRLGNTARTKVEQSVLFDLANGRAMGALHVVGVDLKLRFRVDLRIIGKQKVPVGLLGVSVLRVLVDNDAAMKHAASMLVEDAVIELPA